MNSPIRPLSGILVALSALAVSALLTQLMRKVAAGSGVLDVPNPRSSHRVPTPRGGGVAVVAVTTSGLGGLALYGLVQLDLLCALAGGGLAVAFVGLADDRWSLSAGARLTVHFIAALWALGWLGGLPALRVGDHVVWPGWTGYVFGALGIVWAVNLFNFMDGIDGIAAAEATFIGVAGSLLCVPTALGTGVAFAGLTLASASAGFLLWNWPPARIFLGDVGSGYLGYMIVVLAVAATRDNPVALWVWLILGGAFFVDATVTLLRRSLRGERVHEAHRSHAYQRLASRWGSHGRVAFVVLVTNLAWLLPWALVAMRTPRFAATAVIIALAPLAAVALAIGAGRKEGSVSETMNQG